MLEVAVSRRLGALAIEARFNAPARGVTALFGRSGAGKTSVVNMIAGLLRPESGRIALEGRALFDAKQRVDLPPERRRIGYVFQESRLFPHLSVAANLRYGLRRAPAGERRIGFDQVVAVLDIAPLLGRRPRSLSGGEKQRVAVGRALLANPYLMLMDEPLASLDAQRKAEILPFLERLRDEFRLPIVYVSHQMDEVVRLADTLVLMSDGTVVASGPVEELTSRLDLRPLTGRYEAGAAITGVVSGRDEAFGLSFVSFPGGTLTIARRDLALGARLRVRIHARDVSLALAPPQDVSILNVIPATVREIEDALAEDRSGPTPSQVDVRLDAGGVPLWARVTRRSAHDLGIAPGKPVYALIKAIAVSRQSTGILGAAEEEGADA